MGVTEATDRWAILGPGLWSLLDDAIGAFVLLDAVGRIVDWNRAAEATFGWAREEAVGAEAVELLVAPDLQGEFHAAV
jgi:PAS domain S-box-containing protein